VFSALWINVLIGLIGVAAFSGIALTQHRRRKIAIDEVAPVLSVEVV